MIKDKDQLQRDISENLAAQISELTVSTDRSSESGLVANSFNPQNSVNLKINPNWKNVTE